MQFVYREFWWTIHNLVGHPVMQILWLVSLCGLIKPIAKAGEWVHDWTIPDPEHAASQIQSEGAAVTDYDVCLGCLRLCSWDGAAAAYLRLTREQKDQVAVEVSAWHLENLHAAVELSQHAISAP